MKASVATTTAASATSAAVAASGDRKRTHHARNKKSSNDLHEKLQGSRELGNYTVQLAVATGESVGRSSYTLIDREQEGALVQQVDSRIEHVLHVRAAAQDQMGYARRADQLLDLVLGIEDAHAPRPIRAEHRGVDEAAEPAGPGTFDREPCDLDLQRRLVAHAHRRDQE